MSKRIIVSLAIVSLPLAPAFAACGGGTTNGGSPEGGMPEASGMEGGKHPDAAMDTGMQEASGDDGGVQNPTGTQLVKSKTVYIAGVTSDDFALYADVNTTTLYSVPLAGGNPTMIVNFGSQVPPVVSTFGKVALIWYNYGMNTGVGTLMAWTSASGPKMIATSSLAPAQGATQVAAVSADNKWIIYNDGVDANATTGNVYIVGADGTGKTAALVSGMQLGTCAPVLGFGGDNGVAAYCTSAPSDGGAPDGGDGGVNNDVATISTFTGASFTAATVATNVFPAFLADTAGTTLLVESVAGGLQAYPMAGGSPTSIDPMGALGFVTKDGMFSDYTTKAGALKRSTLTAPAPMTLVASGVMGLLGVSPDEKTVIAYSGFDMNTGLTDLVSANTATAGMTASLDKMQEVVLFGDFFTADSSRVLFYNNLQQNQTGTLNAIPAGGGTATMLGQSVWIDLAATGGKVIYNDNWTSGIMPPQGSGWADLEVIDTSMTAAKPKLIAGQADAYFYLSGAKDKIVYSWSYDNTSALAGIYVIPVP